MKIAIFLLAAAAAFAQFPDRRAASSGFAVPTGLVANSAGAAAANTTAINALLAAGKRVYLGGNPGDVYTVNTPIVTYSHSTIEFAPGVWLKQADSQNTNVIMNYAATQIPTSTGTSLSWSAGLSATLTWPSHGRVVGDYVYVQGATNYVATAPTYSSGASACTNGTQNVSFTGGQDGGSVVVGTITVSGGVPTGAITITNPSYAIQSISSGTVATCTGTATFTGGSRASIDSAFNGVFVVTGVTNANTLTIKLNRVPSAAPTGTIYVQAADVDIHVIGANLDYNASGQNSGITANAHYGHGLVFSGVQNCTVDNVSIINTQEYMALISGANDCRVSRMLNSTYSGKDGIKVFGPAYNVSIFDVRLNLGDDIVSVQAIPPSSFAATPALNNQIGGGDILSVHASKIHGVSAVSCFTAYGVNGFITDDVLVEQSGCLVTGSTSPFRVTYNQVQSVEFRDIDCLSDVTQACVYVDNSNAFKTQVNALTIDGIHGPANQTTNVQTLVSVATAWDRLIVKRLTWTPYNVSDTAVSITGSVTYADIGEYTVFSNKPFGGVAGTLVSLAASAATNARIHDGYSFNLSTLVTITGTAPTVSLDGNAFSGGGSNYLVRSSVTGVTINASRNAISSGYMLGLSGTSTAHTLNSSGGNVNTGSGFLSIVSGTPTVSVYGTPDIQADVSATGISKPAGAIMWNTNSALGTLGAAGPVISNGSNWKLMSDTTKSY